MNTFTDLLTSKVISKISHQTVAIHNQCKSTKWLSVLIPIWKRFLLPTLTICEGYDFYVLGISSILTFLNNLEHFFMCLKCKEYNSQNRNKLASVICTHTKKGKLLKMLINIQSLYLFQLTFNLGIRFTIHDKHFLHFVCQQFTTVSYIYGRF